MRHLVSYVAKVDVFLEENKEVNKKHIYTENKNERHENRQENKTFGKISQVKEKS